MLDLLIRGGLVVTPRETLVADVAIADGSIQVIGPDLLATSREINARGLAVLPGVIDSHLHFNEPGRTEWEGAETGSRALAAGGGTVFFDMPLNSTPCTVNAREFDRKRAALEAVSVTDFGLWGGLVPGNIGEMADLAERGVVGFKAFLCDSGLPEFPRADDFTLFEGLKEAKRLNRLVAVHAESQELTQGLARKAVEQGLDGIRGFLSSRPVLAEVEAIRRAALIAGEAGAQIHIVHVSSGSGVAAAAAARAQGADISIETCPHYLFYTEEDLERLGAIGKCAPPLRCELERDDLWAHVLRGTVDLIASDHSPAPPAMKTGDFLAAWGGIAGVQSTLAVMLHEGHHGRGLALERIAELLAAAPARRYRIPRKGELIPGNDADLVLVDLAESHELRPEALLQRHRLSPYVGRTFRGTIRQTIRRGETIYQDGSIVAKSKGVLVRPT